MKPATTSAPPEAAAAQHIIQLLTGYMVSTALNMAVLFRVPDALAGGPKLAVDLARETGADEDALYRVLRLLASVGVFEEVAPRQFANNLAANMLRSDDPASLYHMTLFLADAMHLRTYADAEHSMRTGQPAVEKTYGKPVFELFGNDAGLAERFNNAMTAFSAMVIPAVLEAYDFTAVNTLVDVAGGHGVVLTSILKRYPSMRGVLFDLDHVIAGAVPRIRDLGLADRCSTVAGDFFKAVPEGGDAYIMKHIIHDWDDVRAVTILKNIRHAMAPGGRVILLEAVLQPPNQPDFGKVLDLEMLLLPGGRERSEDDFRTLFRRAGFELTRIVPTQSPLSVIEAR